MKSHEQCAALLDAYIDGALSEQDAAQVREHLADCPECQSYVADALSMRELFPGVEETAVPDGFAESVMSALPAQKIAWRAQWKKIALPLAACIALALLIRGVSVAPTGGAAVADTAADMGAGGGIAESMIMEAAEAEGAATLYAADWEESAPEADENQTAATFAAPEASAAGGAEADGGAGTPAGGASHNAASVAERADAKSARVRVDDTDAMPPQAARKSAPAPEPSKQDADAYRRMSGAAETEDMPYAAQSVETGAASDTGDGDAPSPDSAESPSNALEAPDAEGTPPDMPPDTSDGAELSDMPPDTSDGAELSDMPPDTADGGGTPPAAPDTFDGAGLSGAAPDTPDGAKNPPLGAAVPEAPPDADAIPEESAPEAPQEQESETQDAVTHALALSVTVWTLSADAAPIMERYPPDAVTDGGKWYVLTPPQFRDLCDRFPDIEITSGPEVLTAASLPADAPPLTISDAVYIFVPNPAP